ncbi:hypothetical protein PbJCM13498_02730 [Prolixibacter bellariivorans]|uniref:Uncharacterized protein n=1 Tax=Prolixibacter bellariivorans TaxID=314319 RepID=A0A5M4ATY6_9BACT|nr:hypothetical protein PbJCM13498_02730 [Prolixibacter bellariivorans]
MASYDLRLTAGLHRGFYFVVVNYKTVKVLIDENKNSTLNNRYIFNDDGSYFRRGDGIKHGQKKSDE